MAQLSKRKNVYNLKNEKELLAIFKSTVCNDIAQDMTKCYQKLTTLKNFKQWMRKTTHIKCACSCLEIWLNKFVKNNNSKRFFFGGGGGSF